MSTPAITVLMTVYNAGRFLDASIASVLGQTFRDFEFLIVDDASTDGSAEVAEGWQKKDPRVRVILNAQNKGQTPCLNQGLALAKGTWIARQDADDLSHPERLARQIEAVTKDSSLVLLGTNGLIIDENGRKTGLLDAPLSHESITWTSVFLNPFMHTAVMFRTDVIRDEFGGYDETYRIAQDYDLWTRVIARHRSANLADRLVSYRHLATSISKAGRGEAFAEAQRVADREGLRVFGRVLSKKESKLIASFRQGLRTGDRKRFWQSYSVLTREFPNRPPDFSRTVALHHLKAAGAMYSRFNRVAEVLRAFVADPRATASWLRDRLAP